MSSGNGFKRVGTKVRTLVTGFSVIQSDGTDLGSCWFPHLFSLVTLHVPSLPPSQLSASFCLVVFPGFAGQNTFQLSHRQHWLFIVPRSISLLLHNPSI